MIAWEKPFQMRIQEEPHSEMHKEEIRKYSSCTRKLISAKKKNEAPTSKWKPPTFRVVEFVNGFLKKT